jgi:hypothetical protein
MFCGISWAEATTSCSGRQNCPSGQSTRRLLLSSLHMLKAAAIAIAKKVSI